MYYRNIMNGRNSQISSNRHIERKYTKVENTKLIRNEYTEIRFRSKE